MSAAAEDTSEKPVYPRVLIKLSGEALMGDQGFGLHPPTVQRIAREVAKVHESGIQICLVIGGGNIFRGLTGATQGMERAQADYMGMLATVMNALGMQSALGGSGHSYPCSLCDPHGYGLRALYPPPCDPAPGEEADRHLRGRDRQPLFHDRYGCHASRK